MKMSTSKPTFLLVLTLFVNSFLLTLQKNMFTSFPLTLVRLSETSAFKAKVGRKNHVSQSSSSPFNSSRFPFKYYPMALIASFSIGTPSQNIQMVLDTGSQLTWMACGSVAKSFHRGSSRTFSDVLCKTKNKKQYICPISDDTFSLGRSCNSSTHQCGYSYRYADGALAQGNFVKEKFTFSVSQTTPPLILGCTSTPDSSGAEGIMGMNLGPLSFTSQLNLETFSYCVPNRGNKTYHPTGRLYLGPNPLPPTFQYVSLLNTPRRYSMPNFDPHAYSVTWSTIVINTNILTIPRMEPNGYGQTIIDSGTLYTYVDNAVYNRVKKQVLTLVGSKLKKGYIYNGLELCFDGKSGEIGNKIGDMKFGFRNKDGRVISVVISKENVLDDVGGDVSCFAIASSKSLGDDIGMNIIGNFHQQNYWVEFDVKNRRLGFGNSSDCNRK